MKTISFFIDFFLCVKIFHFYSEKFNFIELLTRMIQVLLDFAQHLNE